MTFFAESFCGDTPLIINLAPTGMVPTREMSPRVPLQPDEIVRSVLEAAEVGITMAHLHARDAHGKATYKKDVYARIIGGIREKREDLILCVSCSGRDFTAFAERSEVLDLTGDLRPDMGSLTLSSLNFARQASLNEPEMVQTLARHMLDRGISPEFEVFDLGMANYAKYLVSKLDLRGPIYANIIVGNVATAQADLLSIAALTQALPPDTIWGLGGIGISQVSVTALAAAIAPAARLGLEDNLWVDRKRTQLASNAGMVRRMHDLASLSGRAVMTPDELRKRLGLRSVARPATADA